MRTALFTLFFCLFSLSALANPDYEGMWWDPAQAGQGVSLSHQGDAMFMAWYAYDNGGAATFYTGAAVIGEGNVVQFPVAKTAGVPVGAGFNPSFITSIPVGTATITFSDAFNAVMTFTVEGMTGHLNLERFVFRKASSDRIYTYVALPDLNQNCESYRGFSELGAMRLAFDGNGRLELETIRVLDEEHCIHTVDYQQRGNVITGGGAFSCETVYTGTVTINSLLTIENLVLLDMSRNMGVCRERLVATGIAASDSRTGIQSLSVEEASTNTALIRILDHLQSEWKSR